MVFYKRNTTTKCLFEYLQVKGVWICMCAMLCTCRNVFLLAAGGVSLVDGVMRDDDIDCGKVCGVCAVFGRGEQVF